VIAHPGANARSTGRRSHRRRRRFLRLFCLGVAAAALAASLGATAIHIAAAADPTITLTLTPTEVTLITGASADGSLVIANAGPTEIKALVIKAVASDPSVEASVKAPVATTIAVASATSAEFSVTRVREGSGQAASVRFVVTFELTPVGAPTALPQVQVASLKVNAAVAPALISAKFESGISAINEFRPADAALVVTNLREREVSIGTIEVSSPAGVKVSVVCPTDQSTVTTQPLVTKAFTCKALTIAPRSQQLVRVRLTAPDTVSPGSRSVVVRLTASDGRGSEDVVAVLPVTVDIFAEAEILKSLGVPVFLLLPGLVVLVTAWTLIAASPYGRGGSPLPTGNLVASTLMLGVLALATSLVMAVLYPILTSSVYPGTERDYTRAYGFRDFYFAFAYSVVVGAIVGSPPWILHVLRLLARRYQPAETDDAMTLLRKLAYGGRQLVYRRVTLPSGKNGMAVHTEGGKTLVTPSVQISVGPQTPSLREDLELHIERNDARGLFDALRQHLPNDAALDWDPADIDKSEWVVSPKLGQPGRIVEVLPP